jgi:single-stranded-DNA-specific exonuclease
MSVSDSSRKITRRKPESPNALRQCDIHPVLMRVYENRNIKSLQQIDYTLDHLLDYRKLKDIENAASIISDCIVNNEKIVVVGDFDADGATSSALVVRALRGFGLEKVDYLVPNRFEYGYGLTPEIVSVARNKSPDLIITVDNGISSIDGVAFAKHHSIKVVVTDHHLPGKELPNADAIVNPNQQGCSFPSKSLAGVGVAFYVMLAVRACLREIGWFNENKAEPNMGSLLDLVALGTVADVVPLDENNRVLVDQGLQRIRKGKCCDGIKALLNVAGKDYRRCTSQDFGFIVGPRLNAAGRLDDMSAGIECLLADDMNQADEYAALLDDLNQKRKLIENDMLSQAMTAVEDQLSIMQGQPLDVGISLYNPLWHQGVVGLLASRIKEYFHRPVIAFANADSGTDSSTDSAADTGSGTEEGNETNKHTIKGSARSIPGLHIRDVLDAIATKHPQLIIKFGGHAMAAGLSLSRDKFDEFSCAFVEEVRQHLSESDLEKRIETDGALAAGEMTLESAEILRYAGPWGQHFPEPVFDDEFDVLNWVIIGGKHLKFQLHHKISGSNVNAIAFNKSEESLPDGNQSIRAAYRMDVNEFRGNRSLQLIIEHIEPA